MYARKFICLCTYIYECMKCTYICEYMYTYICTYIHIWVYMCIHTGWRRSIGCLKLQVIFRKRATLHKAFLRKMTYEDKASYGTSFSVSIVETIMYKIEYEYIIIHIYKNSKIIGLTRGHVHWICMYVHTRTLFSCVTVSMYVCISVWRNKQLLGNVVYSHLCCRHIFWICVKSFERHDFFLCVGPRMLMFLFVCINIPNWIRWAEQTIF